MAIIPQVQGQALLPASKSLIELPKTSMISDVGIQSFLDVGDKAFGNYFKRVHKKYSNLNTTNIETLVYKILHAKDSSLINYVKEKTSLKETFKNRFFQEKTSLGEVLQELQYSQESSNRKLLSTEIFQEAEKEANDILIKKGKLKSYSNALATLQKRKTSNIVKIGSEFQVNTYTTFSQERPSVAVLSNGKFVVTWTSNQEVLGGYDIYGQIFNADGSKSGSEFQVNTYITDFQEEPAVASLNSGQFVVTWQSYGQDGSQHGIFGQIFNQDGSKSGSEFQVNTYTLWSQYYPSIASLSNGNFIITWQSENQDEPAGPGIYGQIFNPDGTKNGSEFQVNTYTTSAQVNPSVASLNNGKFVVTWASTTIFGWNIVMQIFNADGSKSGSEVEITPLDSFEHFNPSVTTLSNGNFVIAWEWQNGSEHEIHGQIFNSDGSKNGSEFQVNTYAINTQLFPSIATLSNGEFIITWQSEGQDGSGAGIFGQMFNSDGSKNSEEFLVNTYTTLDQRLPSAAGLNNDTFVVTWDSGGQDGFAYGIFGQIFKKIILSTSSTASSSVTTTKQLTTTSALSTTKPSSFSITSASLSTTKKISEKSTLSTDLSSRTSIFQTSFSSSKNIHVVSGADRQTEGLALRVISLMSKTVQYFIRNY